MSLQLKEVYNQEFFNSLNLSLQNCYSEFDPDKFMSLILTKNWKNLELKQRMCFISQCLDQVLTDSYQQNIQILKKTAKNIKKGHLSSLSLIIFSNYVEIFGLNDFSISIEALEYFTEYGSAEFAIRHFIIQDEERTLKYLLKWSRNENYHIRRLASEGCRPRLPWGIALSKYKKDPSPILPILEILKDDESEYVRRSVANNLNDISKDNPEIALALSEKWLKNPNNNLTKLVKHGLRGLLKKGEIRALKLFNIDQQHQAQIKLFALEFATGRVDLQKNFIKVGDDLEFSFQLINPKKNNIRLEYAVYFAMKNGKFSKKIYQITSKHLGIGEFFFKKNHSFKIISTRKYYPGLHKIVLILNGLETVSQEFNLI